MTQSRQKAEYKITPGSATHLYCLYVRRRGWIWSRWDYFDCGTLGEMQDRIQDITMNTLYYDAAGQRTKGD